MVMMMGPCDPNELDRRVSRHRLGEYLTDQLSLEPMPMANNSQGNKPGRHFSSAQTGGQSCQASFLHVPPYTLTPTAMLSLTWLLLMHAADERRANLLLQPSTPKQARGHMSLGLQTSVLCCDLSVKLKARPAFCLWIDKEEKRVFYLQTIKLLFFEQFSSSLKFKT